MQKELVESISNKIKDFRSGEGVTISLTNIEEWAQQFGDDADFMLAETNNINIFFRWIPLKWEHAFDVGTCLWHVAWYNYITPGHRSATATCRRHVPTIQMHWRSGLLYEHKVESAHGAGAVKRHATFAIQSTRIHYS